MKTTAKASTKAQPFPPNARCHTAYKTALWTALFFAAIIGAASNLTHAKGEPQARLPVISLAINNVSLAVEVAADDRQRQRGLSYRTELGDNEGMLFVYKEERPLLFTMRETLIPLSIAFISEDWVITEILEMTAGARENYPSQSPAQYALEMNAGWFSRQGIKPGDKVTMQ